MGRNLPKRIKVMIVVTRVAMDSAGKQAILIAENLNKDEYEPIFVRGSCESNEVDMSRWLSDKNIRQFHIPEMKREIRLFQDFIAFWKMFWICIREKPDIVHTRTAKAGTVGRLAARFAGVPVVIHTFDGHVFKGYFGKTKTSAVVGVERWLASLTDRIIAISNKQKDELIHYLKIKAPDKIQVVPIGFKFDEFKPAGNGALRKELNISEDDLVVGYVGRLAPIKRVDRLIDACERVVQSIPSGKFVIVGDGELREEMEERVRQKNLEGKVFFLGVRSDLENIYSAVDVVALSSDNEGTPAAIIEALNYGKPVASTNVGGIPDVITDGVSGILADPDGCESLADALITMLSNEKMRERMGRQGRVEVLRKFSLERLIKQLDELYKNEIALKRGEVQSQPAEVKSHVN